MVKSCKNCGATVLAEDTFCSTCGNELSKSAVSKTWVEPGTSLKGKIPLSATSSHPISSTSHPRKFYRSREDRWIAGVCGGLGEYFDIDPVLIRVVFVILSVMGGIGILVYLLLAILAEEK